MKYDIKYEALNEAGAGNKDVLKTAKECFNQICNFENNIVRVIGYHEDLDDCYYHYVDIRGKQLFGTGVGCCYSLKPYLPKDKYEQTENIFEMNGGCKADTFYCTKIDKSFLPDWKGLGIEENQ